MSKLVNRDVGINHAAFVAICNFRVMSIGPRWPSASMAPSKMAARHADSEDFKYIYYDMDWRAWRGLLILTYQSALWDPAPPTPRIIDLILSFSETIFFFARRGSANYSLKTLSPLDQCSLFASEQVRLTSEGESAPRSCSDLIKGVTVFTVFKDLSLQ